MLPKNRRINTKYEFNKVKYLAKKFNQVLITNSFQVFYIKNLNEPNSLSRFGFIISNKFEKSAVKRNYFRRVLRELVRKNFDKIEPGYLVVILPRYGFLKKSYEELNLEFVTLLQNLSISG